MYEPFQKGYEDAIIALCDSLGHLHINGETVLNEKAKCVLVDAGMMDEQEKWLVDPFAAEAIRKKIQENG